MKNLIFLSIILVANLASANIWGTWSGEVETIDKDRTKCHPYACGKTETKISIAEDSWRDLVFLDLGQLDTAFYHSMNASVEKTFKNIDGNLYFTRSEGVRWALKPMGTVSDTQLEMKAWYPIDNIDYYLNLSLNSDGDLVLKQTLLWKWTGVKKESSGVLHRLN